MNRKCVDRFSGGINFGGDPWVGKEHVIGVEPVCGWKRSERWTPWPKVQEQRGLYYRTVSPVAPFLLDIDDRDSVEQRLRNGSCEVLSKDDEDEFIKNAIDPSEWFNALRLRRKLEGK